MKATAHPSIVYEGRVTVIHNSDLERKRPWTNVLYLYPERVVVRTYDHWQKSWRPDLERTIRPPARAPPSGSHPGSLAGR